MKIMPRLKNSIDLTIYTLQKKIDKQGFLIDQDRDYALDQFLLHNGRDVDEVLDKIAALSEGKLKVELLDLINEINIL